jgi:hypothetical protein
VDPRDPRRVVVALVDYNPDPGPRAVLYTSTDGGRTFRGPVLWPLGPGATFSGDPSLASDRQGRMYFSYSEYAPAGTSGAGGIYVARSLDGGRTWDAQTTRVAVDQVDPSRGRCHFHDKEEIATDPRTGAVLVAWLDDDYDGSADCHDGFAPAFLARSTDRGRHFVTAMVSGPTESTVGAMPRVGPDGTVYVAYTRYVGTLECPPAVSYGVTVVVARSRDDGRTFSRAQTTPVLCMPYNPNLTLGTYRTYTIPTFEVMPDGTLVLATVVQDAYRSEVVVVRSTDRGRTWRPTSVPAMLPGGQYQFPRLALGPGGLLAMAYVEQLPGGLFSCLIATSRDAGKTWGTPLTVSSQQAVGAHPLFLGMFNGDYIGLAIGRDRVAHPTWTDTRGPDEARGQNVRTRRIRL